MGTRKLKKNVKKWFAGIIATVLALTTVSASGFTGLFAEGESPVTIETTQTVNDDPATATVTINATAKEGYSVSGITFNNETIEGEEGTFTVFANGEYQVAVKYTTEGETPTTSSPETSLEPTVNTEASEEPIDEEFGISRLEETAPVVTEEVTPEVTEETTPETTEEITPEVTEEAVPAEQSEEPVTEEVTPETAFNFFTAVYAEEDPTPEATETTETTEETYTETINVEGLVEQGTFISVEETDETYDNLVAVLGEGVTVTKNEEKSTELGYNVYDVVAIDPSDELAVSVEGTYTHGFTAGSKDETTGWYIAIPGLTPVQWAFSFGDETAGDHDGEAREAVELMSKTTISSEGVKIENIGDSCDVELRGLDNGNVPDISAFDTTTTGCPLLKIKSDSTVSATWEKLSFGFDVAAEGSINPGDTITIPVSGFGLGVDSAAVELKDNSNNVIGTWEITSGKVIIKITETIPSGIVSGVITTAQVKQSVAATLIPNDYRVRAIVIGSGDGAAKVFCAYGRSLVKTSGIIDYSDQNIRKASQNASSSDVQWVLSANNGAASFTNNNGVANQSPYTDVVITDTFPAGTTIQNYYLNVPVYGVDASLVAVDSTFYNGSGGAQMGLLTQVTQSGGQDLETFKGLITAYKYGIFTDPVTQEVTFIVNFGSFDSASPTYNDAYGPNMGSVMKAGGGIFGEMTDAQVTYLNDLYDNKPIQFWDMRVFARYPSVIADTPVENTALFEHNGVAEPKSATATLTPGASLFDVPSNPKTVKFIKSNNNSQLVDGATFKLQSYDGSNWNDATVNALDVTTGSGSGTSLFTDKGLLIVENLSDGTYRIVETSTPSGYKTLNAANYPTNYVAGQGIVTDNFVVNSGDSQGHVVQLENVLEEADYTVKHFKCAAVIAGAGVSCTEDTSLTETKWGVPLARAEVTPKTITGYTNNFSLTKYADSAHAEQSAELRIAADGKLVVNLYYIANKYSIKYNANGPTGCSITETMANQTDIKYNEDVTLTTNAYTCTGYAFGGWAKTAAGTAAYTDAQTITKANLSSVNGATVNLYAKWTPNTNTAYTVEHYKQNVDGTYPTTASETENKNGTTAATVAINTIEKTYTGFTTDTSLTKYKDSANSTPSTTVLTIKGDGSLIIQVFYKRNTHNITYSYTGTIPTGVPAVPTQETGVRYGASKTVAANPVLNGYTFSGWTPTAAGTTYTMPNNDVALSGSWTEKSNYTVKYETNGGNAIPDMTSVTWTQDTLDQGLTPTRSGYTFNGWYTDSALASAYANDTYADIATTDTVMDITLYAKWTFIPTPDPATPDPGRTCQDDGYPAGYNWNGTACVCTEQICMVTPTPVVTTRPTPTATTSVTATPKTTPTTSPVTTATASAGTSPETTTGTGTTGTMDPGTSGSPEVVTSSSPSTNASVTPDTTKYTLVDGEVNIYKDENGNLYVYDPSYGYRPYQWSVVNLIAALASVILGVVLVASKSSKDEDPDDDEPKRYNANGNEVPNYFKRNKIWKLVGAAVAVVAVVLFIMTENISYPIKLVDKYTLIMIILALASLVTFFLGRKWTEDTNREDDEANA